MEKKERYSFLTEQIAYETIETKSGKRHYVTGYISTPDIDLYNDLITEKGLKSMLRQINESTIMLDYEHEAWRDDATLLPVGKIVDAKIDDRGLWVKAELNKSSPKFKDLWGSIKEGFLKAFSIAFQPVETITKAIGETEVRIINDLTLLNVALTGTPVNPNAAITQYGMKSVMLKAINDLEQTEANKMSEKKVEAKDEAPVEEQPKEEVKEEVKEEAPVEEKPTEEVSKEEPKVEEPAVEQKSEAVEKLTAELKALTEKMEKQEAEIKALKEEPVFKSKTPEQQPEEKSEGKDIDVLNFIR